MPHHLEETAPGMMVLLVGLKVPSELLDALGEHCYLDLSGAGVGVMGPIFPDYLFLLFLCDHLRGNYSIVKRGMQTAWVKGKFSNT